MSKCRNVIKQSKIAICSKEKRNIKICSDGEDSATKTDVSLKFSLNQKAIFLSFEIINTSHDDTRIRKKTGSLTITNQIEDICTSLLVVKHQFQFNAH